MIPLILALLGGATARAEEPPQWEVARQVLGHEQELLAFLAKHDPPAHSRLVALKDTGRPEYVFGLLRVAQFIQRAKADPEFAERERRIRTLEATLRARSRGYEELPRPEQKALRAELETMAGELMDLKQADRRARLEELRTQIAQLEEDIAARDTDRDRIIDEYVDQLVVPPVDL